MALTDNTAKINQLLEAINNLPAAGSGDPVIQSLNITPSESEQEFKASTVDGYKPVTVGAISKTYVGSNVPRKSAAQIKPGTSEQYIDSGTYMTGRQTILGDADLKAENIMKGVTIFDILGTFEGESSGGSGGGLPSGVSKLASGTITPTDDATYLDIQHGLGVAPNFLVWFVENDVGTTGVASLATDGALLIKRVRLSTSSSIVYNVHYFYNGYNASTGFGQSAGKYANSTDMTATIARMRTVSPYMFKAGYKYHWICGVMDSVL